MTNATAPTSRVPAGVPTGGQFAANTRAESQVTLSDSPADRPAYTPTSPDGFSRTWPTIRASERRRGTVRLSNGAEVTGYLSTHGTTYPVDVETDDGRYLGYGGWRVVGIRLEDEPQEDQA